MRRWKPVEKWLGTLFGLTRPGEVHGTLYLRFKYSVSHSVYSIYIKANVEEREIAATSRAPRRPVVIGLAQQGQKNGLLCFHSDDFAIVHHEWLQAKLREEQQKNDRLIRDFQLPED